MSNQIAFYLLRPGDLPRRRDELASDEIVRAALAPLGDLLARSPDEEVLEAARRGLERLQLDPGALARVENDPAESFESHANDQSFHIVRVIGPGPRVAAYSTLDALVRLLESVQRGGTDLDAVRWGRLRRGFATIVDTLALGEAPPRPSAAVEPSPSWRERGERDALQRWTHGHYAFMAIVQGLVVILHSLEEAFAAGATARVRGALAAATSIMWGTEAALRFAGDFAYASYERAVRPTLMPPIAPPGMTGLHWRDHRFMISQLARIRNHFQHLESSARTELDGLFEATAAAYESHKYVCAGFVGDERPSLLMASRSEKTAIETLDHFKTIRLGLLDRSRE